MRFATMHKTLADLTETFSLNIFSMGEIKRLADQALDKTGKWHQRDCPLKAPFILWFVVIMAIFRYKSIANIMKMLMITLREVSPELSLKPVTTEAIVHARKRLGVEPLKTMFELMSEGLKIRPTFHGFRIWTIDGVSFTLADTAANEKAFGRPPSHRSTAAFPQMQAVALISAETHQVRDCIFSRYNSSEREASEVLIQRLGSGDLLLADRGFPSVEMLEKYFLRGFSFVVRISSNWKPHVISRLGPGDYLVEVSRKVPESEKKDKERRTWRPVTMRFRLIEYRIGNQKPIRLLTNLIDAKRFNAIELAQLYHQRWDCEISYDEIKTHLVTVKQGSLDTHFRSKTPEGVQQEAYGILIAYNLIRGLMAEAAVSHHISPLEISFVDTLEVIESSIPYFERAIPENFLFLSKRLLDDIAACRIDRPRRQRSYPRKVRVKMSSYKRKNPSDKEVKHDYQAELQLIDQHQKFQMAA
jgi:hypothetical protein